MTTGHEDAMRIVAKTEQLTLQREIHEVQNQLRDLMARLTHIGSDEAKAIERARSWLGNITKPLLDGENEAWLSVADDVCSHMDPVDYEEQLTAADKRSMTNYMSEE